MTPAATRIERRSEKEDAQQRERPLEVTPAAPQPPPCVHPTLYRPRRAIGLSPLLESPDGPRRRLPRHRRLDAHRAAQPGRRCSSAAAASGCCSTAARGRSASCSARPIGLPDLRGDLPHALPRRPFPRPAGDAQDVRAARPRRDAAHGLRAARPGRAVQAAAAVRRPASVPAQPRRARAGGDGCARGDYAIEPFAVEHGIAALGYALVEAERPGRVRRRGRRRARRSRRARSAAGSRRARTVELAGRPRGHAGRRAGRAAARAEDRDHRRHGTVRRSSSRRRTAPTSSSTRRASSREEAERAKETMHSTAVGGGRGRAASRRCGCSRSRTCRRATSGRSSTAEALAVFPDTVVPRDFDVIEVPFAERGAPQLVKKGARPPAGAGSPYDRRRNERHGSGRDRRRRRRGGGDAGDPPQCRHRLVDRASARGRRGERARPRRRARVGARTRSKR